MEFEEYRLDDVATDPRLDPGGLLRQAATGAAQVRRSRSAVLEAGLDVLAQEGRPRSVVIVGTGITAFSGDVLEVLLGTGLPVPVTTVEGTRLPGWVGAYDLVVVVAVASGQDDAGAVAVVVEAARRGCRLLAVGVPGGPLAGPAEQVRAPYAAVPLSGEPRTLLWAVATALLTAVGTAGLRTVPEDGYEATAVALEDAAHRCAPGVDTSTNPAKVLALELAGSLPVIWGTSPVTALAARRFASQLAADARYPALAAGTPGAVETQAATLSGPLFPAGERSIFDDPETGAGLRPRVVLLKDDHAAPQDAAALDGARLSALGAGAAVTEIAAKGAGPMERLAGLIALTDYASLYLAVAYAVEPLTNTLVVR
ncbi:SIS domain-containing protein [Nocardiopsis ansamitocini]|uniref:SIS domain-containing protein n=1 Tax=Nocardiopsis ansamitocini TaxID=1670832 RepID=A0A9W6P9J1_9ACTN|nr:SIS domain-containing protein [Nocardiopsis ansamitocini]GLU49650.1 hypothetical protein Nans01_40010 [Nocardiopsis ansamitocini]